jgi:cobalt/nickel transport system ATP-binding protein
MSSALMLVGHGSRSPEGVAEYWRLAGVLRRVAPALDVGCGFIELAEPDLDAGFDALVAGGARSVVAVPLVLLGASHLKADGPEAMARARLRHPGVHFAYARALGIHPTLLALAEARVRQVVGPEDAARTHVVLVGRGSSDPDANADLYKVARLLWDGRGFAGVEPAFVSLAYPSVPEALERCRRLGATRVAVVPYFLFTGVLVERIAAQARAWTGAEVVVGEHLGAVEPVANLVLERYREALEGGAVMNCDLCIYRVALPGYEDRVVRYAAPAAGHHHRHQGRS